MEKSTKIIIGLSILCLVLLFLNFRDPKTSIPTNYDEMSPGQLLDEQLVIEGEISVLVDKKKQVQSLRDEKTASIRGEEDVEVVVTGEVVETPITQLNEALDLN